MSNERFQLVPYETGVRFDMLQSRWVRINKYKESWFFSQDYPIEKFLKNNEEAPVYEERKYDLAKNGALRAPW